MAVSFTNDTNPSQLHGAQRLAPKVLSSLRDVWPSQQPWGFDGSALTSPSVDGERDTARSQDWREAPEKGFTPRLPPLSPCDTRALTTNTGLLLRGRAYRPSYSRDGVSRGERSDLLHFTETASPPLPEDWGALQPAPAVLHLWPFLTWTPGVLDPGNLFSQ